MKNSSIVIIFVLVLAGILVYYFLFYNKQKSLIEEPVSPTNPVNPVNPTNPQNPNNPTPTPPVTELKKGDMVKNITGGNIPIYQSMGYGTLGHLAKNQLARFEKDMSNGWVELKTIDYYDNYNSYKYGTITVYVRKWAIGKV